MSINIPLLALTQVVKLLSISMHSFYCQPALWGAVMKIDSRKLPLYFKKGAVFLY